VKWEKNFTNFLKNFNYKTGEFGKRRTQMSKKKEIKSCPFCGGRAVLGLICSQVTCSNCGTMTKGYTVGYKAIEVWNKRAENKALKEELDEVRKAGIGTLFELRRVQGSRDELLEAGRLISNGHPLPILQRVIRKAKAQKEQEKE